MTERQFLDSAYTVDSIDETRTLYDEWAQSYDAEIARAGYATPGRCARALARFEKFREAPILDVGCGTGISGLALAKAGFRNLSGCDLSREMLDKARLRQGLYRDLWQTDLNNPFPFARGTYRHICAVGVLATGHAPASTIDSILACLPTGGLFVFSLNDHTLENPGFEARISEHVDCGAAGLIFKQHGPHLPGIGLKSQVYVMRKH
jgi:predicted TPR repeat methyltransferase